MGEINRHLLIVIVPLVLSNSLHMVIVKRNLLPAINTPLWAWGFGRNKTWRGLLFVPVVNALVLTLLSPAITPNLPMPAVIGFVLGLAYMIFELPNSFMKRRLGIAAGESPGKHRIAFSMVDKMDSAIGVVLAYLLLGYCTWQAALWLLVIASATHVAVSALLVILRLKSTF
jgi:hypothetical protein